MGQEIWNQTLTENRPLPSLGSCGYLVPAQTDGPKRRCPREARFGSRV